MRPVAAQMRDDHATAVGRQNRGDLRIGVDVVGPAVQQRARRGRPWDRHRRSRRRALPPRSGATGPKALRRPRRMRGRSRPTSQPAAPDRRADRRHRLEDHVCDDIGLRHHDHVRAVDLGDRRARPLRHRADDVGPGGLVAGGNNGPRRQVLPCRRRRWARRTPPRRPVAGRPRSAPPARRRDRRRTRLAPWTGRSRTRSPIRHPRSGTAWGRARS